MNNLTAQDLLDELLELKDQGHALDDYIVVGEPINPYDHYLEFDGWHLDSNTNMIILKG
nr:hypothetical protein [Enterococcus phage Sw5]